MAETLEQYLKRLAGCIEGKDPLSIQRQTAAELNRLTIGFSVQQLRCRPPDEEWSIIEILAHLAEDELAAAWRYRQMVERDGAPLCGFDQSFGQGW